MTAEEFTREADEAVSPAVERLIRLAFETVPVGSVAGLVGAYLDIVKECALETVRMLMEEEGFNRKPS